MNLNTKLLFLHSTSSDFSILPAFRVSYDMPGTYSFSTVYPNFRVLSGDESHTLLSCVTAEITPDLGPKVANTLTYFPVATLIVVAIANLFAAIASPWGSSDPFHFTSNYGRDEDLLRLVTPTFSDCLQYLQFMVLAGSLSLNYPGFYQPAVSHSSWSALLFNQSFVSNDAGRPALSDGVYDIDKGPGMKGLDIMAQLCGLSSGRDIWAGFVIWLLVTMGAAIVISQLFVAFRWLSLSASGDRDHSLRSLNLPFTAGNVLRVIVNFFLLPAIALSLFQLVKTKSSPAASVVFAVILLLILLGGIGYILFLIRRTKPQSYLFDDLSTALLFGPLYNTYTDESASFFTILVTTLTFIKGIAIGAVQASGIAQLVLLAISEIALVITIMAFRPYAHATHMNLYYMFIATIRFLTIILSVAFIPALDVSESVRGWIGYVNLGLHTFVLMVGFLLNAFQTLIEVGLRLCGAGGDSSDPRRGGLAMVLGMRQLSRRTTHAPHHSINSAAEILVRPSGQFDPDDSRHSRSLSAGSTLLLGRNSGLPPGTGVESYDPTGTRSRTNSVGAARALTPSAASAIMQSTPSPIDSLPAAMAPASQRAMGLAALRSRDQEGGPFYRQPRPGPVRTFTRRRNGGDTVSGPEAMGMGSLVSDDGADLGNPPSGYLAAAHDDPEGDSALTDDVMGAAAGRSGPPAKDYAIREADFYYRVRGPALSAKPTRKLKTGPANPIETNEGGVAAWFNKLFGSGKTKEKGKGFEVVRSHRALDVEDGIPGDESDKGESIHMSTRARSQPEQHEDDDEVQSVHDNVPIMDQKEDIPPESPYSLVTTDLFPEPYHDEPFGSGKGLQRNFSRSEAGSIRYDPGRQMSTRSNHNRASVLHEVDEDSDHHAESGSREMKPFTDLSTSNDDICDQSDKGPISRSTLPVLPDVEHVDAIELPSRFNSTSSTASGPTRTNPSAFIPPPPSGSQPPLPLPAPPSSAVHRPSASELSRNASLLSRAPTIPRRSSKRTPSGNIIEDFLKASPPLPSVPTSYQSQLQPQADENNVNRGIVEVTGPPNEPAFTNDRMASATPSQPDLLSDHGGQPRFPFLGASSIDRSESKSDRSEGELTADSMSSSTGGPLKHFATSAAAAAAAAERQASGAYSDAASEPMQSPITAPYNGPVSSPAFRSASGGARPPNPLSLGAGPTSAPAEHSTPRLSLSSLGSMRTPSSSINPAASNMYAYLPQVPGSHHREVSQHRASDGYVHSSSHTSPVDLSGSRAEVVSADDVSTRAQTPSDGLQR